MPGSKIVVNHRVMLSGSAGHGAIGGSRLLYIANRPGAVAMKSDDDLRIERENARMAKLGYISYRPGSVPEPNQGHALFDARGVPERAGIQRELKNTESAIVTSVVTVRREDAEGLGLTTKQDWERLLRSQWPRYVESLGVMEPQNIRWVAAYHVNQENNLHCHVFTWDETGDFNSLLPKQKMRRANDALRAAVLKPQRDELSLQRTQARDELVARMRGIGLDDVQRKAVVEALPNEGSLKYAKLAKFHREAVSEVDAAVRQSVEADQRMQELRASYEKAVLGYAELKGLEGAELEAYVSAAEADLKTRLGNALISNVGNAESAAVAAKPEVGLEAWMELGPPARKRAWQLAEEVFSCLDDDEMKSLSSALRADACAGTPLGKNVLRRLPSVGREADAVQSSLSANAKGAAVLARQALSDGGKGDYGDEVGQKTLALAARALGAAIAHAERLIGTRAPGSLIEKQIPIRVPVPKL